MTYRSTFNEEMFHKLIELGVGRNQAALIASTVDIEDVGSDGLKLLAILTADETGRTIPSLNASLADTIVYLKTPEGKEWSARVIDSRYAPETYNQLVSDYKIAKLQFEVEYGMTVEEALANPPQVTPATPARVRGGPFRKGEPISLGQGPLVDLSTPEAMAFIAANQVTQMGQDVVNLGRTFGLEPNTETGKIAEKIDVEEWMPFTEFGAFDALRVKAPPQTAAARAWAASPAGKQGLTPRGAALESAYGAGEAQFQNLYSTTETALRAGQDVPQSQIQKLWNMASDVGIDMRTTQLADVLDWREKLTSEKTQREASGIYAGGISDFSRRAAVGGGTTPLAKETPTRNIFTQSLMGAGLPSGQRSFLQSIYSDLAAEYEADKTPIQFRDWLGKQDWKQRLAGYSPEQRGEYPSRFRPRVKFLPSI